MIRIREGGSNLHYSTLCPEFWHRTVTSRWTPFVIDSEVLYWWNSRWKFSQTPDSFFVKCLTEYWRRMVASTALPICMRSDKKVRSATLGPTGLQFQQTSSYDFDRLTLPTTPLIHYRSWGTIIHWICRLWTWDRVLKRRLHTTSTTLILLHLEDLKPLCKKFSIQCSPR